MCKRAYTNKICISYCLTNSQLINLILCIIELNVIQYLLYTYYKISEPNERVELLNLCYILMCY